MGPFWAPKTTPEDPKMSKKYLQTIQKTMPKGPQNGQIGNFGSPKGPRKPFQGPKWPPRGSFLVSLETKIGLRELIWGRLGAFRTVLGPKMTPRRSPRDPKVHLWTKKRPGRVKKVDSGTQKGPKRGSRKARGSQNASFGFQAGPFGTKMGS